jgi:hypothetical protein
VQKSSADDWARPLGTPLTVDGTNFLELRKAEARRMHLPRTPVNRGIEKGRTEYDGENRRGQREDVGRVGEVDPSAASLL